MPFVIEEEDGNPSVRRAKVLQVGGSATITNLNNGRVLLTVNGDVAAGANITDNAIVRGDGGAKGMLWCSQVATANENGLRLRIYGEKGGIEWNQEDPNYLWYTPSAEPKRLLTRAGADSSATAGALNRTPAGHPEGYLEGFANIYTEAARAIEARRTGAQLDKAVHYPGLADGLAGMAFIDACVRSSKRGGRWVTLADLSQRPA